MVFLFSAIHHFKYGLYATAILNKNVKVIQYRYSSYFFSNSKSFLFYLLVQSEQPLALKIQLRFFHWYFTTIKILLQKFRSMKQLIFFVFTFICSTVTAQDASIQKIRLETQRTIKKPTDTSNKIWKKGGLYGINISQGSLSNWAAGGDNFSLSVNSILNTYAFYKNGKLSWDNTFDFNLGYVNTTSIGGRKNDDRFDFLSKVGHAISPKLSLAELLNFRSQIFKGYTFSNNVKTYASNFLAPGYLLLSAGLDYKPTKNLSIYFSPASARWVIVNDTALANKGLYGVTPGKKSKLEFGGFATVNYLKEFNKFVSYKGRLDLFSNYNKNPQNVDVFLSNTLNAKLGKLFAITWSVDMIYDDDVRLFGLNKTSPSLQLKSLVGIGFQVKF